MLQNVGTSAVCGQRAFALQYTSIILIILCFVIGAFANGRRIDSEARAVVAEAAESGSEATGEGLAAPTAEAKRELAPENINQSAFGTVSLDRLFGRDGLNAEDVDAIAAVLLNHDVDAEIVVPNRDPRTFHATARQADDLWAAMIARGVPERALSITIRESDRRDASVHFTMDSR